MFFGKQSIPSQGNLIGDPPSQMDASGNIQLARLKLRQEKYLERIHIRKEHIKKYLSDDDTNTMGFTYDVNAGMDCNWMNSDPEQLYFHLTSGKEESPDLMNKLKRCIEKFPDRKLSTIVPIRGVGGLKQRINLATNAHEKLQNALNEFNNDSATLRHVALQLKQQLERVNKQYGSLIHQWLRIVKLLEEVSMCSETYEINLQNRSISNRVLQQLESEFDWNEWQDIIKVLYAQLCAMSQSNSTVSSSNQSILNMEAPTIVYPSLREKSLFELLKMQAEAIESHSKSVIILEKQVQKLEEFVGGQQRELRNK